MHHRLVLTLLGLFTSAAAQSNAVPGRDAKLFAIDGPVCLDRRGPAHPDGEVAIAYDCTLCNTGTVQIPWNGPLAGPAPMAADHPFFAFMVARESGGRMVQLTDRATYLEHAGSVTNAGSACGGLCIDPGSTAILGVGCGDSSAAAVNADRFWLAPVDEVDPWLGTWNPFGSYFDRGDPEVAFPGNQDGVRSLDGVFADGVKNRVTLRESDLLQAGSFYYAVQMVVPGEDADLRLDDLCYRPMTPSWDGSSWTFANAGPPATGSVLDAWQGATVSGARNGESDGHFFVGVKVTGPVNGMYHYEYAVHDVDNARGGASLRIPVCPSTVVADVGFRDLDSDPLNDWTWSRAGDELVFAATGTNPLRWNELFNFWFDCAVAPENGAVVVDEALPGPGALQVTVNARVPGSSVRLADLGPGCGAPQPAITAEGLPSVGNSAFGLDIATTPNAAMFLFDALRPAQVPLENGCVQYLDAGTLSSYGFLVADAAGNAHVPLPIPNTLEFEGLPLHWQAAQVEPGGILFGELALSNGLLTRVGCHPVVPQVVQFSGFETGDFGEFWEVAAGCSVQNTLVHSGNAAMRCFVPGDGYAHATMTAQDAAGFNSAPLDLADLYASFYFRYALASNRSRIAEVGGMHGATKARLELEVDRRLSIFDFDHTDRFYSTTALQPDRWYRLRWYVGTGTVARTLLMIDNAVEIDVPNATLSNEPALRLHVGRSSQSGGPIDFYIDDVVISSGGFVDDGEIRLLLPEGAGAATQWSGSFADVDDWPHDGDLTFCDSAGNGTVSVFALQDPAAAGISGRVLAIKSLAVLRRTGTSGTPSEVRLVSGAVRDDTAMGDGGELYRLRGRVYPFDPATGQPWTLGALDALEVGAESGSSATTRMTAAGVSVLFVR